MISIKEATEEDFAVIRQIAYDTWPATYSNILSAAQLSFMLGKMYSEEALAQNAQNGHRFLLVGNTESTLGFAAYEHDYEQRPVTRLHKLYVLPSAQGTGAGKALIDHVEQLAREYGSKAVSLNVNRFNTAYGFYLKRGYEKTAEVDIPIGDGFFMEDYAMEKKMYPYTTI